MSELRSQKVEISATALVALTSIVAGFAGAILGYVGARPRHRDRARARPGNDDGHLLSVPNRETVTARRESAERRLEDLRRNYELDVGLLKHELRQIAGLGVESRSGSAESAKRSASSGGMRFSPLKKLAGGGDANGSGA